MNKIFVFLVFFTVFCTSCNQNHKMPSQKMAIVTISPSGSSALKVHTLFPQEVNVSIGASFSNAIMNITLNKPELAIQPGKEQHFSAKELDYQINLPIYWSKQQPYAYYESGSGMVESLFLLFRTREPMLYNISFTNISVYNSAYGRKGQYVVSEADIYNTYFLFGNFSICSMQQGTRYINVAFSNTKYLNKTLCEEIFLLYKYFHKDFGTPTTLRSNYTIGRGKAKSYSSYSSGFFIRNNNMVVLAHELFHLWQQEDYSCGNDRRIKEGLAMIMNYIGLKDTGIISETQYLNVIKIESLKLRNASKTGFYHANDTTLFALRETKPEVYQTLTYSRGLLIWDKMRQQGIDVKKEFLTLLQTKNCTRVKLLVERYDFLVYNSTVN